MNRANILSQEFRRNLLRDLVLFLLINTLIALFLSSINFGLGLKNNLIYSQCIGLAIALSVRSSYRLVKKLRPVLQLAALFFVLAAGAVAGIILGNMLHSGVSPMQSWHDPLFLRVFAMSLLFGTVISYLFISQKLLTEARAQAQEEKIQRLAGEKQALEMYLKLLQAQIEPHFLFNTLSNIHSLMATDPVIAEKMLLDLTGFLRASLAQSRQDTITVGEEMKMIRAYLDIFKIRMGNRLNYDIIVDEGVEHLTLPPMLIQPLVENSLTHGLEPLLDGGEITVHLFRKNDCLHIRVRDTGVGLQGSRPPGTGTASVMERIAFLYGERGRVEYAENQPHGLTVDIEIPQEVAGTSRPLA